MSSIKSPFFFPGGKSAIINPNNPRPELKMREESSMGKYDQYIVTKLYKRDRIPGPTPPERDQLAGEGLRISMEHVLWVDSDVIPGAYYGESTWIWPVSYPGQIAPDALAKRMGDQKPMFPHVHDFPEILSWWGTDPEHPEDTRTMAMIMGDEEIRLEKSWVGYIPAGMLHMPKWVPGGRATTKPVLHWTSGPGIYNREPEPAETKTAEKKPPTATPIRKTGEMKNAKYFVYGYSPKVKRPAYMRTLDPKYSRPMNYIDETVVPGAEFGCDTQWLLPGDKAKAGQVIMDERTLPYGTAIVLSAMNYADITDLAGEAELWIGGEKNIISKSFGAFLPANVKAGPLIVRNIKQQTFFMMTQPVGEGIKKYGKG
jgi:hypothetical protein